MGKREVFYWSGLTVATLGLIVSGYQYLFGTYFAESKIIIDRHNNTFTVAGVGDTGSVANFVKVDKPVDCAMAIEAQYPDDLVPAGVPGARPIFRPGITRKLPTQCINWLSPKEQPSADQKAPWISSIDWGDIAQKVSIFVILAAITTFGLTKLSNHEKRRLKPVASPPTPKLKPKEELLPDPRMQLNPIFLGIRDWTSDHETEMAEALVEQMAPSEQIVEPEITPGMSPIEIYLAKVLAWIRSHMPADKREAQIAALDEKELERIRNYT